MPDARDVARQQSTKSRERLAQRRDAARVPSKKMRARREKMARLTPMFVPQRSSAHGVNKKSERGPTCPDGPRPRVSSEIKLVINLRRPHH